MNSSIKNPWDEAAVQSVQLIRLQAQYRILSEVEDLFPQKTVHPAGLLVRRKMDEIMDQITQLEQALHKR